MALAYCIAARGIVEIFLETWITAVDAATNAVLGSVVAVVFARTLTLTLTIVGSALESVSPGLSVSMDIVGMLNFKKKNWKVSVIIYIVFLSFYIVLFCGRDRYSIL